MDRDEATALGGNWNFPLKKLPLEFADPPEDDEEDEGEGEEENEVDDEVNDEDDDVAMTGVMRL